MSEISSPTPSVSGHKPRSPRVWGPLAVLLLAGLSASVVYGYREHRMVRQLTSERNEMTASLDSTRSLVTALSNRVNELANQQAAAAPAARPQTPARRPASHRPVAEDPRWKEIRAQLAEQQKQIEANREDLGTARTELQGSIARTHDELVLLEKKGERQYYEFDLTKQGQFHPQGPVGLRLRKADTKHQFADLELMVDDVKLSKKHVNLYEPAFFYSAGSKQPAELVINSITKNHIHGYVAEPKYKSADLEAMANSGTSDAAGGAASGPTPQPRQRLEPPRN